MALMIRQQNLKTDIFVFLYVFVNLTSILYLGAVAINGIAGGGYLHFIMIGLSIFALLISLAFFGSIAWFVW
jgi:SSS family solute:Na+ symporter